RFMAAVLLIGGVMFAGAVISTRVLGAKAIGTEQGNEATQQIVEAEQPQAERATGPKSDQPTGRASGESKIRALLKDKLATVKEIVAEQEKSFQAGKVSTEDVLQAKLSVLKAELDLCESDKEGVAVHERIVALTKELESAANERFKALKASTVELLT